MCLCWFDFGGARWISLALVSKALRTSDLSDPGVEGILRALRYDCIRKSFREVVLTIDEIHQFGIIKNYAYV